MVRSTEGVGRRVAREVGLAVLNWVLAMTGLFGVFHLAPGDPARTIVGQRASAAMVEQVRAELGLTDPLPVQWVDWLVGAATLDYGASMVVLGGEQASVVIFSRLPMTLLLIAGVAAAGVAMTAAAFVAVVVAEDRELGGWATGGAVLVSTAAPVVGVVAFTWLAGVAGVELFGRFGTGPDLATSVLLAGPVGGLIALPLVGLLARRFQAAARDVDASGPQATARALLTPRHLRALTLDGWLAVTYAVGALVVVETFLGVNGLGQLWVRATASGDVLLLRAVAAFVVSVAVLGWLARNLVLVALAETGETAVRDGATAPAVPDGGTAPADPDAFGADSPGAVVRSAVAGRKATVGGAGLALALVAGIGGSLVLAAEHPTVDGVASATGPGRLLSTLGTMTVVALLAAVVATVPAALFGALSTWRERPLGTALRVPAGTALVVPVHLLVGFWLALAGGAADRLGFELVVATTAGLVLSGYAFHAARAAAGDVPGPGEGDGATAATGVVIAAAGRTLGVAPLVAFVAAEVVFLGLSGPPDIASAFVQLYEVSHYLFAGETVAVLSGVATAAVPLALPVASLALLGDGVAETVGHPGGRPAGRTGAHEPADVPDADQPADGADDEHAGEEPAPGADPEPTEAEQAAPAEPAAAAEPAGAARSGSASGAEADGGPGDAQDASGPGDAHPTGESGGAAAARETGEAEAASDVAGASATTDPTNAPSSAEPRAGDPPDSEVDAAAEGPPSSIPRVPDVSVDYDAIERVERLGTGGNADVHLVRVDGQELALKEPRFDDTMHAGHVERFLEEAETWAKLDDGDHVVGVVDYDEDPLPWLAMEYMDADHLGTVAGDLPLDRALWTAVSVVRGVNHAHRRGVAHLDLKPANVLLRSVEGAWDVPKVADWGLAKLMLDHSHSVEGFSPQYAAPEQFDPDAYGRTDQVTDVYQLGAVFYELFTGETPFEGQSARVMHAVLNDDPTPPSEVDPELPPELDDVLLGCLAKEKDDRYETVLYLRDDLQELYEDVRDGR